MSQIKVYCRKVLRWLPSRRSVGSAAWHTALEILDAFVVRWVSEILSMTYVVIYMIRSIA